jgi:hypothetical protein
MCDTPSAYEGATTPDDAIIVRASTRMRHPLDFPAVSPWEEFDVTS